MLFVETRAYGTNVKSLKIMLLSAPLFCRQYRAKFRFLYDRFARWPQIGSLRHLFKTKLKTPAKNIEMWYIFSPVKSCAGLGPKFWQGLLRP